MTTVYNSLEEALAAHPHKARRNKYNVAKKEDRTWRGKTYASKGEMQYAQALAQSSHTDICEQVKVRLGEDTIYIADFLVIDLPLSQAFYIDYKGVETREFAKVKKLWPKYGRLPLHIVRRGGTVDIIEPAGDRHGSRNNLNPQIPNALDRPRDPHKC